MPVPIPQMEYAAGMCKKFSATIPHTSGIITRRQGMFPQNGIVAIGQ